MLNTTMTSTIKDKKLTSEFDKYPLDKYVTKKTFKDFMVGKIKSCKDSLILKKKKTDTFLLNNDKKTIIEFVKNQKIFSEDSIEDLTQEKQKKNSNLIKKFIGKSKNKISKNIIDTVNLIDEDTNKSSRFSQFSVKQSKYIFGQKLLPSIKLSKGNIKDHEPKKIICGYQKEGGQKIYLVEWYNKEDVITLPSFITSEVLKEKHTELIVEYLENIIAKQ